MSEPTLVQFRRSPVLHIDGGYGTALCGRNGFDAMARGFVRDHLPGVDKPICKRCERAFGDDQPQGGNDA